MTIFKEQRSYIMWLANKNKAQREKRIDLLDLCDNSKNQLKEWYAITHDMRKNYHEDCN